MMVMLMTQMFQTHTLTPVADAVPTQRFCRHCQSKLDAQLADEFCCHGCRTAYELIESFELKRFYEIVQENRDSLRPAGPQKLDYRLFDAAEFQEGFVEKSKAGQQTAHFYLENMSCYACVWVCEQVTKQIDPEASLSINLSSGEATLDFKASKVALSEFLSRFETMGFPVSPNSDYQQDEKQEIARIGVALFCVMNIMMLAFPEYLGAESLENRFRDLFRWISTVLAALSVFYSGWPFIRGARSALRSWSASFIASFTPGRDTRMSIMIRLQLSWPFFSLGAGLRARLCAASCGKNRNISQAKPALSVF
jgi:Cu2+-exporting ATPase